MLSVAKVGVAALARVFAPFSLTCTPVADGEAIPGSFWGAPEAGLVGDTLYLRGDTPVHSALHEGAHFICMDAARRQALHTDAGGGDDEEVAVCYLQTLVAQRVDGYDRAQLFADMGRGYHQISSAERWYFEDAADDQSGLTTSLATESGELAEVD